MASNPNVTLTQKRPPHILSLLDDFLKSLPIQPSAGLSTGQKQFSIEDRQQISLTKQDGAKQENRDQILRVADFLFGNKGSLLESALSLLDEHDMQNQSNGHRIQEGSIPVICKIRARRSGRVVVLVRKQHKKISSGRMSLNEEEKRRRNGSKSSEDEKEKIVNVVDEYYLCLLGRGRNHIVASSPGTHSNNVQCRKGIHCTCRSFLEKMKASKVVSHQTNVPLSIKSYASQLRSPSDTLCKHLLAAILAPYLLSGGAQVFEKVVDDREFARLIMKASIG